MKKLFSHLKQVWKLVILFILILITFSYAMFQGGFVSWFLFCSFLPFALYGLALAFYRLKSMRVTREINQSEFRAGETLHVKIKLERTFPFPLFYLIIEEKLSDDLLLRPSSAKTITFPYFRRELEFEYHIEDLPRGEIDLNEVVVKVGDPLGLIEKKAQILTGEHQIIVYPTYEELNYRMVERQLEEGAASSREQMQRDTSMAVGIREYQPGDRFSWINWKATAKRNEMMTKEFEQGRTHDVNIVMDCVKDRHFEIIVSFTASLIHAILRSGAQLGLYSTPMTYFSPRGGESYQKQLFYHLAKVKDNSPQTLGEILAKEAFSSVEQAVLILITGQLTKELIEEASRVAARKGKMAIFVMKEQQEKVEEQELFLKKEASSRGIDVVFIHNGYFQAAFSEVKRA